jgi:dTDP-4-dehydrorhamnose reductase
MFQTLGLRYAETWCTIRGRRNEAPWASMPLFQSSRVLEGVDVSNRDTVDGLLRDLHPTVIVNCVGVIKQRLEAHDPIASIVVNSLLPHWLAAAARPWGGRVIHFSTDCVFSGRRGGYTESDETDATDLYGRTKQLGELTTENALTLRTSFIGRELHQRRSLLEWLIAQNRRTVKGYCRVWWSGVTSNHLADFVADLIATRPQVSGLYHLSSARISKYELLVKLRDGYDLDVQIESDESIVCDRSLNGRRLEEAIGYRCPSWDLLIEQLVRDQTPYDRWVGEYGNS